MSVLMWKNVGQIKLTGPRKTVENRNKLIFTKTLHRADLHKLRRLSLGMRALGAHAAAAPLWRTWPCGSCAESCVFLPEPPGAEGPNVTASGQAGGRGGALSLRSRRTLSEAPTMPAPRPPGRRRPGFHANRGGRAAAASGSRLHGGRQAWRRGSGNSGDRQTDTAERRRFTAELPRAWAPRSG